MTDKITDLQKIHFKPVDPTDAILKKITSSLLFVSLLLSLPLFAKNTFTNEDNAKIIISGDANVFDSRYTVNDKVPGIDSKKIEKQNAVIFVSEDAIISDINAFSNVEIIKVDKAKKTKKFNPKKTLKKPAIVMTKIQVINNKSNNSFYHSTQESGQFSQNQSGKIVFLTNSNQHFSKAIVSSQIKTANRKLYFSVKQIFTYVTPNIRISHFSGRYSIRPPTFYV